MSDLAVGAPLAFGGSGRVFIYAGRAALGLDSAATAAYRQGDGGTPGTAEDGDTLGWSLAAGDLDGDGTTTS